MNGVGSLPCLGGDSPWIWWGRREARHPKFRGPLYRPESHQQTIRFQKTRKVVSDGLFERQVSGVWRQGPQECRLLSPVRCPGTEGAAYVPGLRQGGQGEGQVLQSLWGTPSGRRMTKLCRSTP